MTVLMTGFPGFLGSALLPGRLCSMSTRCSWCWCTIGSSPKSSRYLYRPGRNTAVAERHAPATACSKETPDALCF